MTERDDAGPGTSRDGLAWPCGPASPLRRGAVHVWRAHLDRVEDELLHVLSEQEHARAKRFPRRGGGVLWARSRAVLRVLLARYLDADPAALTLRADASGRPSLRELQPISFSLSHSGASAMYAFTCRAAVGVDIETAPRPLNEKALAHRLLSPERAERLELLEPMERRQALMQAWTRREAEFKCGVAGEKPTHLWVIDLDVGPSGSAALAVRQCLRPELLRRSWSG